MAKIYDVVHDGKRAVVFANSITEVREWILDQHNVEIGSASPQEIFEHRQAGGEFVDLVNEKKPELKAVEAG